MKEYKIVDAYTYSRIKQGFGDDVEGWEVEQVVPKSTTRIDYEYVLVREKKAEGAAG